MSIKNVNPEELNVALNSVMKKDFYLSEAITGKVLVLQLIAQTS